MIKTASFFAPRTGNEISIAKTQPKQLPRLDSFPALAPTWDILNEWQASKKDKAAQDRYTDRYLVEILGRLDPHSTAERLEGKTLVCWCRPGEFCHRHIVADWLRHYGYQVEEE